MHITNIVKSFKGGKHKVYSGRVSYFLTGEKEMTINFDIEHGKTLNLTLTFDELGRISQHYRRVIKHRTEVK